MLYSRKYPRAGLMFLFLYYPKKDELQQQNNSLRVLPPLVQVAWHHYYTYNSAKRSLACDRKWRVIIRNDNARIYYIGHVDVDLFEYTI